MKYNKKGESRIEISDILDYFKDINSMYNDCLRHDSLNRMLEDLVAETREDVELERKTGKWIPCKDRYPESGGMYLVSGGGLVWTAEARHLGNNKLGFLNGIRMPFIEAWMDLPKPYKGGE